MLMVEIETLVMELGHAGLISYWYGNDGGLIKLNNNQNVKYKYASICAKGG